MFTMSCPTTHAHIKNKGIRAQADLTTACGQIWEHHDGNAYNAMSDIEHNGQHISVKAYHFTLMSGTLCEGKTTLPEIWDVYARNTHSNLFAYVTKETAYMMDMNEFREFVFKFCEVERESNHGDRKGTGSVKVRAKRCENNMVKWFEQKLTA